MDVLKYIPEGRENAVTAETLATLTGCDERTVRGEIKRLREQESVMILSSSRSRGYWLPGEEDLEQVREYANMMRSYARECEKSALAAERWLLEHEKKGRPGNPEAAKEKNINYSIQVPAGNVKEAGVCGKS